jgi:formate-dependent nitrite reductase membrane component NrfD
MSALVQVIAAIGVVIASAVTRITGTVLGQHFSVPPIAFLFLAAVLGLAALVLYLIRQLMQDRPQPSARLVHVITSPEGTR